MPKCTACKATKQPSEFWRRGNGLQYRCKACQRAERARLYIPTGNKPGSHAVGSKCKSAKLNETDVYLIKRLISHRIPMPEIAQKFEVSTRTIHAIKYGESWTHVA